MFLKSLSSFLSNALKARDVMYRGKMPNIITPFLLKTNKESNKEEKRKTSINENQTDEKTKKKL